MEFLLSGCAIAILRPGRSGKRPAQLFAGAAAVVVLAAQAFSFSRAWVEAAVIPDLRVSLITVAAATLIYVFASGARIPLVSPVLEFGPVRWIGRISYGIYLYHILVFFLLPRLPDSVQDVLAVVHARNFARIGLVLAVSALSFYAIERPFLRLKARFGPGGRSSNPPATVAAAATGGST